MVKYDSSNGDLHGSIAAQRRSSLTLTWPWVERHSVTAGRRSLNSLPGPCDSDSSRAFCSRPAVILLRSASIYGDSRNPVLPPNYDRLCCLYTWTWRLAACSCMPSHESRNCLHCSGLGSRVCSLGAYIHGAPISLLLQPVMGLGLVTLVHGLVSRRNIARMDLGLVTLVHGLAARRNIIIHVCGFTVEQGMGLKIQLYSRAILQPGMKYKTVFRTSFISD